jgi:hypothetical protein
MFWQSRLPGEHGHLYDIHDFRLIHGILKKHSDSCLINNNKPF